MKSTLFLFISTPMSALRSMLAADKPVGDVQCVLTVFLRDGLYQQGVALFLIDLNNLNAKHCVNNIRDWNWVGINRIRKTF